MWQLKSIVTIKLCVQKADETVNEHIGHIFLFQSHSKRSMEIFSIFNPDYMIDTLMLVRSIWSLL